MAGEDEVRQWERDWRETITSQLKDVAAATSQVALIVREMQPTLKELKDWKDDMAQRRADRSVDHPNQIRANIAIAISSCSTLIFLLEFLSQHWK